MYSVQCTVYIIQVTGKIIKCTAPFPTSGWSGEGVLIKLALLCRVDVETHHYCIGWTVYSVHCTVYSVHCTLNTVHCTLISV